MKVILSVLVTSLAFLFFALADQHSVSTPGTMFMQYSDAKSIKASQIIGANLYVSEIGTEATSVNQVPNDWQNVANISDIIMTQDGEIRGILIDIGGFLGIGSRTIMINISALELIERVDNNGLFDGVYVIMNATRERLENAPVYEGNQEMMHDTSVAVDQARYRVGVGEPLDGYVRADFTSLSANALTSAGVYDASNERVAGVNDIILSADAQIEAVIVDVGGFLGLGTRTVAVSIDDLEFYHNTGTDSVRIYLNMTEEQLENAPVYEGIQETAHDTQETNVMSDTNRHRVGVGEPLDGYVRADFTSLSANDLTSAGVYDTSNERVAGVNDIILSADGQMEAVLVDVGGFLGLGERTVAVPMENLEIYQNASTESVRIYLNMTEAQLENLPEYNQ